MFTVTLRAGNNGNSPISGKIYQENVGTLVGTYAADADHLDPNSATVVAFTSCQEGENVYILSEDTDRAAYWLYGDTVLRHTSFSGYLMAVV